VNIDVMNAAYTATMIILAFVSAMVITKTIMKYVDKNKEDDES